MAAPDEANGLDDIDPDGPLFDPIYDIGPVTQRIRAKKYLEDNKVPQMFQSLLACLMLERPDNHFAYLETKLEEIKSKGVENVNWETFVYHLHPTRNESRLEYVHDAVWEKLRGETEKAEEKEEAKEEDEQYQPQLFNLTEAVDQ